MEIRDARTPREPRRRLKQADQSVERRGVQPSNWSSGEPDCRICAAYARLINRVRARGDRKYAQMDRRDCVHARQREIITFRRLCRIIHVRMIRCVDTRSMSERRNALIGGPCYHNNRQRYMRPRICNRGNIFRDLWRAGCLWCLATDGSSEIIRNREWTSET